MGLQSLPTTTKKKQLKNTFKASQFLKDKPETKKNSIEATIDLYASELSGEEDISTSSESRNSISEVNI